MNNLNDKKPNQEVIPDNPSQFVKEEQTENIPIQPDVEPSQERPETQPEANPVVTENLPKSDIPVASPVEPAKTVPEPLSPQEEHEIEEVEDILEEDLGDVYSTLDPKTQINFKQQGEETTKAIVGLLHKARIKTNSIIKIIVKWLRIIPGLNRNFIEQEAKIKTDKIVEMHEHEHKHEPK